MATLQRVEVDDPNRCQAVHASQQCPFRAAGTRVNGVWQGAPYCLRHGGNIGQQQADKEEHRLYLAALWRDKIGQQADHPKVKSLREEIGILRMTLNAKLESIKDTEALAMNTTSLTEVTREIGRLVKVAQQVETAMGYMLDKNRAQAWVMQLIDLISFYVKDPDDLKKLSEDMILSLEKATNIS